MKYFKSTGTIILTLMGLLVFTLEMFRASEHWYLSLIFLVLGLVVLPLANWNKARKNKGK
jgi:predicted permease